MKYIFITFIMMHAWCASTMNNEKNDRRKSISPRNNSAIVSKHSRNRSLTDRVLITLNLKTDETSSPTQAVEALTTERRAPGSPTSARKEESSLAKSSSRNFSARAKENNRNNFVRSLLLSYAAIRKIQTLDDDLIAKSQSYIKETRYYYIEWLVQEVSNDNQPWVKSAVEDEMKPLQEEFDKKMASLKEAQKK